MVSFHPNPTEMQCQIIFKILHNGPHLTCQQGNAENFPSLASAVYESRSSRCSSGFIKGRGTRDQKANIRWIIGKAREFQKYICFIDYVKGFDCVSHNKLWKILKEMAMLDCLSASRNLYAGQKATVRTGHGTTDWLQIAIGVHQGCILSPCLFNSYRVHRVKCQAG